MLCLQTGTVMSDPGRMKYNSDQFYMKSGAEMLELFRDFPQALANTVAIAERCNVELRLDKELHFPTFHVPEGYSQKEYLIKLGKEGLRKRYGIEDVERPKSEEEKKIADRFKFEAQVIEKTGFINYFLVVWDFIRYAHEQHIPSARAAARARAASSPTRWKSPASTRCATTSSSNASSTPSACRRRTSTSISARPARRSDRVREAKVRRRELRADSSRSARSARRRSSATSGASWKFRTASATGSRKMVPEDPDMTIEKALAQNPEFRQTCETDPNAKRIMQYARVLEACRATRHSRRRRRDRREATHRNLPLGRDKDKQVITQFEMKPLGMVGLLKMDFLGLKTLTILQEAVEWVKKTKGVDLD